MLQYLLRSQRAGGALTGRRGGNGILFIACLVGALLTGFVASAKEPDTVVQKALDAAGLDRGLCCVLAPEGGPALEIAQSSRFFVHALAADDAAAEKLRREGDEAGFGIGRLLVEKRGGDGLPYADNIVDLVVAVVDSRKALDRLRPDEVLRVLRPEGKVVVVAEKGLSSRALRQWAGAANAVLSKVWKDSPGAWALLSKPPLEGADEWTHWEHGPDNNPVSTDQVIKAPYRTQFLAKPFYITMPAITTVAGGRTFLATGHIAHHEREWDIANKLIARNGYNGITLWERDLPKGYMAHRSAFVASKDAFYMIDGDGCLMLDPQTGEEKGRIELPGVEGELKWIAMLDGVLYALVGEKGGEAKVIKGDRNFGGWSWSDLSEGYYVRPRVPWGYGHTLLAFEPDRRRLPLFRKRLRWRHTESTPIDSRALAVSNGGIFLYCPEKHLRRLDAKSGDVVWTNDDPEVLALIEAPGRNLVSTPGFRSACLAVATPEALILQGQTRMNVIAVSAGTGDLLWQKKKFTNNPNVIYVDGKVIAGVGPRGSHVALDPVSGEQIADLGFRKIACTRLTACPDSLFVRGEGMLRYDREGKKSLIDGGARPGCNDGAIAANGLLYIGPWACDCNLSLIGAMAKCSAGDFRVDAPAGGHDRLWRAKDAGGEVEALDATERDWPMYRADVARSGSTPARLARPTASDRVRRAATWTFAPSRAFVPTPPVTVGRFVFLAGDDGKVRALDAQSGEIRWEFATGGPIKASPTIWNDRAYVGGGDGCVYALEAATGRLLWRFRAAPFERKIMVYGHLCSTWPVNTGVLVADGTAYFAAGIIDSDGTYVYALDAETGELKWSNNTCGHLSPELRKGVSAQGCLTLHEGELLMAGGNQVSPARFDLETGKCLNQSFAQGQPKANHGKLSGVLFSKYPIVGGRIMYASPRNLANKDGFAVLNGRRQMTLNFGGVPPAWDDEAIALVNFRDGKLQCYDSEKIAEKIEEGPEPGAGTDRRRWTSLTDQSRRYDPTRWTSDLNWPDKFEVAGIALCPDSVVIVGKSQVRSRAHPGWWLAALDKRDGTPYGAWRYNLPSEVLPEGLAIGRNGQVIVTLLDGRILSFGPRRPAPRQNPKPRVR